MCAKTFFDLSKGLTVHQAPLLPWAGSPGLQELPMIRPVSRMSLPCADFFDGLRCLIRSASPCSISVLRVASHAAALCVRLRPLLRTYRFRCCGLRSWPTSLDVVPTCGCLPWRVWAWVFGFTNGFSAVCAPPWSVDHRLSCATTFVVRTVVWAGPACGVPASAFTGSRTEKNKSNPLCCSLSLSHHSFVQETTVLVMKTSGLSHLSAASPERSDRLPGRHSFFTRCVCVVEKHTDRDVTLPCSGCPPLGAAKKRGSSTDARLHVVVGGISSKVMPAKRARRHGSAERHDAIPGTSGPLRDVQAQTPQLDQVRCD